MIKIPSLGLGQQESKTKTKRSVSGINNHPFETKS